MTNETALPQARSPEQMAEDVLAQIGVSGYPVNPIEVARRLGIPVYWATFDDPQTHGSASVEGGRFRIDVKAVDPPNKRRFTVAHEIGHVVLHLQGAYRASFDDNGESASDTYQPTALERRDFTGSNSAKEVEANAFAAALLMPARLVRERFASIKDPSELAREFKVSEEAMKIRLGTLRLK